MDFAQLMFGLVLGAVMSARFSPAIACLYLLLYATPLSFSSPLASLPRALAWAFSLPIATMIVATSPGGLAEMTITAQALQISVPLVVAFHLFRVVMVNMGTQYLYPCAAWMFDRNDRKN